MFAIELVKEVIGDDRICKRVACDVVLDRGRHLLLARVDKCVIVVRIGTADVDGGVDAVPRRGTTEVDDRDSRCP